MSKRGFSQSRALIRDATDVPFPRTGRVQQQLQLPARNCGQARNRDTPLFARHKTPSGDCICKDCDIQSVFDPNHPNYHHFGPSDDFICDSGICDARTVFYVMLEQARFIAPTYDQDPVTNCKRTLLYGYHWNPIRTTVDEERLQIVNYTLPGHMFHPGKITRTVTENGNAVNVSTEGEGIGEYRFLDVTAGPMIFKAVDTQLIIRVYEKLGLEFLGLDGSGFGGGGSFGGGGAQGSW